MKNRIITPYTFGHSCKFTGKDFILASIYSFIVYESEEAIGEGVNELEGMEVGGEEITKEEMQNIKD